MIKNIFKWLFSTPFRVGMTFFSVITIVVAVGVVGNILQKDTVEDPPANSDIEKEPDSISIPGYEMLVLQANSQKQSLCMPNPAQNCCYFQLSLYLADGTLLWQSELIKPGATSRPIELLQPLNKGAYPNAVLRYSCYRMDEALTPLNGAETKLTLQVK